MIKERLMSNDFSNEELADRVDREKEKLARLQIKIKEAKIPVIVLLEGWGAAGKGSVLGKLINNMDPRFFKVAVMDKPSEEELRRPFLYRSFIRIPEAGKFTFFDSGWMEETVKAYSQGELKKDEYKSRITSINNYERQLTDNGYLLLKFFFHVGKKEQKKRLANLLDDKNTRWRVSDFDKWQNENYDECMDYYEDYMQATDSVNAPWNIVDSQEKKRALLVVLKTINDSIENAIAGSETNAAIPVNKFRLNDIPKLADVDLNKPYEGNYKEELDALQERLGELHNELYRKKIPVIIGYEGWDAAGKGGNIKRLTQGLDPRGYEVFPIASPEPHEKARHYLWRFWNRLPKDGHVAIFDRTWYGRVMVERLEGFCSENDWKRAYNEINEFEKELSDWGAIVIKFWVQIDKETQLKRFNERAATPEKQWKITDEDWRNREKWDLYESAIDEMLAKTNTEYAPWHILESNDKHYARIKALKILIKAIEDRL